jgi:hypothetical protein
LFERKTAAGHPWYEAMPFVCAALARHIYHCLKFKQPYDVEKAFGAVLPASEKTMLDLQADLDEQFEVMEAHLSRKKRKGFARQVKHTLGCIVAMSAARRRIRKWIPLFAQNVAQRISPVS